MVQLRDAQTSQLIAEGTPDEIARIAEAFDPADVLFDDVGAVGQDGRSLFNAAVVRKQLDDEIERLDAEIAKPGGNGAKAEMRVMVKNRRDRVDAAIARRGDAQQRLDAARSRVRDRAVRGR